MSTSVHVSLYPANTTFLYNICTMPGQGRRPWAGAVQMLYKGFDSEYPAYIRDPDPMLILKVRQCRRPWDIFKLTFGRRLLSC